MQWDFAFSTHHCIYFIIKCFEAVFVDLGLLNTHFQYCGTIEFSLADSFVFSLHQALKP